jgi:hypothetical protein
MKSILSKFSLAAGWDLLARLTDTMRSFANKAAASSDRSKAASVWRLLSFVQAPSMSVLGAHFGPSRARLATSVLEAKADFAG